MYFDKNIYIRSKKVDAPKPKEPTPIDHTETIDELRKMIMRNEEALRNLITSVNTSSVSKEKQKLEEKQKEGIKMIEELESAQKSEPIYNSFPNYYKPQPYNPYSYPAGNFPSPVNYPFPTSYPQQPIFTPQNQIPYAPLEYNNLKQTDPAEKMLSRKKKSDIAMEDGEDKSSSVVEFKTKDGKIVSFNKKK